MEAAVRPLTRKRFLDICHFQRPGDLPIIQSLNLFWAQTPAEFVKQGAPKRLLDFDSMFQASSPADDFFEFERIRWLHEVHSGIIGGVGVPQEIGGLQVENTRWLVSPGLPSRFLSEDESTLTYLNSTGVSIRVNKKEPGNMPNFVDHPVKDRATWEALKKHLDPHSPSRYPADWQRCVPEINALDCPVVLEVGGFFGFIREWV